MSDEGKGFLLIVAMLAVLGSIAGPVGCCVRGCDPDYSDGERSGVVWKFSRRGLFRKSWEGELNMGGFRSVSDTNSKGEVTGSHLVPNVFEFSAFEEGAVKKLQDAQASGRRVTVRYRQWWQHPVGRQDSDYEIIDVRGGP